MKISSFSSVKTQKDILKYLQLWESASKEHLIPFDNYRVVEDSPYDCTRFHLATSIKGNVNCIYFLYGSDLQGLLYLDRGSSEFCVLTDTSYIEFEHIYLDYFLCLRLDGTYDLVSKKGVLAQGIMNFERYEMTQNFHFVVICFDDCRSVICLDFTSLSKGIFFPSCLDEFIDYFEGIVESRGYGGYLDSIPLSELFSLYYELQSAFDDNYKVIDWR